MDQSALGKIIAKIGIAIFIIALVDLLYLNYWVIKSDKSTVESRQSEKQSETANVSSPVPSSTASPISSPQATPNAPVVETKTVVQTAQKEIFVPIGSGNTKNRSYTDLSGLEVTIDTTKYSAIESVVFEATVWVEGGNGRAYAQLYNKTDSQPVWNSEVSSPLGTGTFKTSQKLTLTTGSKTYTVQAKGDLEGYAAHVDNARIKIILK